MRADVDLQGTVTAKDLLTQATLVAEKRVVADILGSLNHCDEKKKHVQFLYHSVSISWQNYLLFPSSHFLFYPFQCNKIHSKWCLVSSYLLLETITFTNDGRGGAGIRELCPFVARFFFFTWIISARHPKNMTQLFIQIKRDAIYFDIKMNHIVNFISEMTFHSIC